MHQMGFVNWLVRAAHKKGANTILIQQYSGISGFQRKPGLWHCRMQGYYCIPPPLVLNQGLDSRDHWKRVMQGHAGANLVPVVASNRIGKEIIQTEHGNSGITFMKLLYSRTSKGNCCSS